MLMIGNHAISANKIRSVRAAKVHEGWVYIPYLIQNSVSALTASKSSSHPNCSWQSYSRVSRLSSPPSCPCSWTGTRQSRRRPRRLHRLGRRCRRRRCRTSWRGRGRCGEGPRHLCR